MGTPAPRPPDGWPYPYVWQAVHRDGTVVSEYEADGKAHGWAEVDAPNVVAVRLWPVRDGHRHAMAHIPTGAEPIVRRRHRISDGGADAESWHLLGWRTGDACSVLFVAPDGGATLSSDFDAV